VSGSPSSVLLRGRFLAFTRWLVSTVVVLLAASCRHPVPQPVAFNHLKHTKDLELDCSDCHAYVKTGTHAGLPDAEACQLCHETQQGSSPEAARVTTLLAKGDPLRFNKLFRLAPHVYYSHRRHVGIAQLECRSCHGDIADTQRPPAQPLVRINMKLCMDCHRAKGQSLDCVSCHR